MISKDDPNGLPLPRRYWSVAAIWFAMVMAVLNASIANIALPTISHELGISASNSIWIVNAYQLALAMTLLPLAALGDYLGYRRVYLAGLGLLVAASIGCALASDLTSLALARFAQGLGASGIMAINGALVQFTYPRGQLGRAIGYNALIVALSSAAGPSVAAAVLSLASWRWLFLMNVPLGLLSLLIGWRALPTQSGSATSFDLLSAVLNVATFAAAFLAVSDLAHGALNVRVGLEAAVGLVCAAGLVHREWRNEDPLIPLDLLRVSILRLSYATSCLAFACQMALLLALPFALLGRFGFSHIGFSHIEIGLLITPLPLGIAVAAPVAGRLADHFHAGLLGGLGLTVLCCGCVYLGWLPRDSDPWMVGSGTLLCGIGFGLFQSPNNRIMLGEAPHNRSGAAAGMISTARLVGQMAGSVLTAFLFKQFGETSAMPFEAAAMLSATAGAISLLRLR